MKPFLNTGVFILFPRVWTEKLITLPLVKLYIAGCVLAVLQPALDGRRGAALRPHPQSQGRPAGLSLRPPVHGWVWGGGGDQEIKQGGGTR